MVQREYKGKVIAGVMEAECIAPSAGEVVIRDILIDSRRLITPEGCLFFALVTERNDGHRYVEELYNRGVRSFVVSTYYEKFRSLPDAAFFLVNDTLTALQKMAAWHRRQFTLPVIGITGSNGKTIIKEWLYQMMHEDKKIIRSPKSYNSQIGVPLSLWQIDQDDELAIIEAGISEPDEMDRLQQMIQPDIGIFTNIGEAHSENFINTRQKAGEKLKLFTKVKVLIYNPDEEILQDVIIRSQLLGNIEAFTWGTGPENSLQILSKESDRRQTVISAKYRQKKISIKIPFTDNASIENAIHCWTTMLYLEYPNERIAERMSSLAPIAMRLELKAGINNCTIINDSYNSDFNSLGIALDFLNQQNQHGQKVVILSDILQSGLDQVRLYEKVADILEKKGINRLIGIGEAISRQKKLFHLKSDFYSSTEEFISSFPFSEFVNQSILLKGARIFEFEQISRILQEKIHETVMEINLDALVKNLNYFRSKIPADTKIMAMVKAFSYGSGGFEIANVLQFHHADYLAVAYADEGIELRKAGINLPIMVMNPEEYAFETMIRHQLEPEIFNFRSFELLEKTIARSAIPPNKPVKIHIKLETGMHRLGFEEADIKILVEKLKKNPLVYLQSVFSHLAASDRPDFDDFSREQIKSFTSMSDQITSQFDHQIYRHILNSAGISRFPEAIFEMVRLGISLYGIAGAREDRDALHHVTSMRSEIAQVKMLKRGDSVSYNRSFIADKAMRIGIVSVGYADGLMRNLGNGTLNLYINDQPVPILGDICMDMCIVDLTDTEAKEGDEVVIFDEQHPVTLLAQKAGTIPYEIISRISRRVKRVYYHE
jgi:Alr-MurF fusion protein